MNKPILLIITFILSLGTPSFAQTDSSIYKHVDADGSITFTNRPVKGAQKTEFKTSSSGTRVAIAITPSHVPSVSTGKQQKRDVTRRQILENELADEMKLSSDTRKFITLVGSAQETERQKERMERLQSKLQRHERNITSLKRELDKL